MPMANPGPGKALLNAIMFSRQPYGRWQSLSRGREQLLILAAFFAFFLLLLLPVPVSGSVLGSVDSLYIPALANTYINRIQPILSVEVAGLSMCPASIVSDGESIFGIASIFMLFNVPESTISTLNT